MSGRDITHDGERRKEKAEVTRTTGMTPKSRPNSHTACRGEP